MSGSVRHPTGHVFRVERAAGPVWYAKYVVIYERAEDGGWGAYLPDPPGVVALGATRKQAARRIKEALSTYAEDLQERGGSLPVPQHATGTVAA